VIATSPEARVQRELDDLAEVIGRSVSLDDASGALVGYSVQGDDVDRVRVRAILTRRVSHEVLEHQRRHGVETARRPVRVPANERLGMAARLCIPLGRGRTRLGYLWILDEDEALRPAEIASARKTARRLVRPLEARVATARAVDALFERLVRSRRPGADAIPQLCELAGIETDGPVRVVVALAATARTPQQRNGDPVAPDWTDAARSLSRLRFVAAAHVQPENVALLVLATADIGAVVEAVAETLIGAHARKQSIVVGISPPARLAPQSLTRQQATATLAAGCAFVDPGLPHTLAWTDLGIYRRLLLTTRPSTWNDGPLLNQSRSSALLEHTLETYLDNAGDPSRTATVLNIHRTTLYYRLGRLKTEHGIDLQDGLTRTDLHAAIKLRRLALARRRFRWPEALITLAIAGDEQAQAAAR
jgi:PucR family transcriptional regulator, proline-responsive transcriptional activator